LELIQFLLLFYSDLMRGDWLSEGLRVNPVGDLGISCNYKLDGSLPFSVLRMKALIFNRSLKRETDDIHHMSASFLKVF